MGNLLICFNMLQSQSDHPGEVRAISETNISSIYSCFGSFGGKSQPFCQRFQ